MHRLIGVAAQISAATLRRSFVTSFSAAHQQGPKKAIISYGCGNQGLFTAFRYSLRGYVRRGTPTAPLLPLGTIIVNPDNYRTEVDRSALPVLVYYHTTHLEECVKFTKSLQGQVERVNRENSMSKKRVEGTGQLALAVKLAMIDVDKELFLAEKFQSQTEPMPQIHFVFEGRKVDEMTGFVTEGHIRHAIEAFIEGAAKMAEERLTGRGPYALIGKMSTDEENALTLLQKAKKLMMEPGQAPKVRELCDKAIAMCEESLDKQKKELGVGKKKMTPEMLHVVRANPHYSALPLAHSLYAMSYQSEQKVDEARRRCELIREKFPLAVSALREVSETLVRIELQNMTNFDPKADNYISLLKHAKHFDDPVKFYWNQVKLSVCHYFEGRAAAAVKELLRVVRVEPQLMAELEASGAVTKEEMAKDRMSTPARKVLVKILDVLGPFDPLTDETREKLQSLI